MTEKTQSPVRLSLTKGQRQTSVGIELLSLCQTITEDGSLSDQEIDDLQKWLSEHRTSDLPSIDFLAKVVEGALADRKITKEERLSIYKAIEKILPADMRYIAADRRRAVQADERELLKQQKEKEKAKRRDERERNRPLASWNFMVAGIRYEGRPAIISKYVQERDAVSLQREHSNKYSRNAVAVYTKDGRMVGYVPEDDAVDMAPLLDRKVNYRAYFTKILTGGRCPIPVVQADFYGDDATVFLSVEKPTGRLWIYILIGMGIIYYWVFK